MISYPNREMIKGFLKNIDYMLESIRCYSQDPIHYTDLTDDEWDQLYHMRRHLKQAEDQAEQLIRSIEQNADAVTYSKQQLNATYGAAVTHSCVTCEYFDPKNKICEMHPDWEPWAMSAIGCHDYGSLADLQGGDQNV